ncbi:MAG TPA: hypothetical protein VHW01_20480 [Polyangiaceae bacterium]|nr:hypothetical protein [Polyangiaceae bacterium]
MRAPFSGKALAHAGQPSKFGGRVGRVLGIVVLVFGLLLAAVLMLCLQLLWPAQNIGYALGLPVALIAIVVSALLMIASQRLNRLGADAERGARVDALYALAAKRGGTLTVTDAAHSLQLAAPQVDALLGDLAKTQPESVSLELDDAGEPFYLFSRAGTRPHPFGAKYRVTPEGRVRVADVLGADGPRQSLDDDPALRRNGR